MNASASASTQCYSVVYATSSFRELVDQVNPHTANGHRLVMVVSSSGCALEIGESRWQLTHLRANSMQSVFIAGQ